MLNNRRYYILTGNLFGFFFFIFLTGFSIGTSNTLWSAFLFPGDIEERDDVTEADPGECKTRWEDTTGSPLTGERGNETAISSNPKQSETWSLLPGGKLGVEWAACTDGRRELNGCLSKGIFSSISIDVRGAMCSGSESASYGSLTCLNAFLLSKGFVLLEGFSLS